MMETLDSFIRSTGFPKIQIMDVDKTHTIADSEHLLIAH